MSPLSPLKAGPAAASASPSLSQTSHPSTPAFLPPPLSAARKVYDCLEVRQEILTHLAKNDLASFMRVEKDGVAAVESFLYRSIEYLKIRQHMSSSPDRHKIYTQAVKHIHVSSFGIPPAVQVEYGIDQIAAKYTNPERVVNSSRMTDPARQRAMQRDKDKWLGEYRAEVLPLLVSALRRECPSLRTITYDPSGSFNFTTHVWALTLDPKVAEAPDAVDSGRITTFRSLSPDIDSPPPVTDHYLLPSPSPHYSIVNRFNLCLKWSSSSGRHYGPSPSEAEWLAALRNEPAMGNLYKSLDIPDLPVTLNDLTNLYRRQIEAGHKDRLRVIKANGAIPEGILEFRSFASIASIWLVSLQLGGPDSEKIHTPHNNMTFDDLPSLISIVRGDLPNLQALGIVIRDTHNAESVCRKMLSESSLDEGGTVNYLNIFTLYDTPPLYNTIRALSPLCTNEATVHVRSRNGRPYDGADHWFKEGQTSFFRYLRRQTTDIKSHLSTINFKDIGITIPTEIQELRYEPDGWPLQLPESRARAWAETFYPGVQAIAREPLGALNSVLQHCVREAESYEEYSPQYDENEADGLLETVRKAKEAAGMLRKMADELEALIPEGMVEQLEAFCDA